MVEPIRFYFDQNIQGAVTAGLRQHGIDVLTAQESDRCGLPDPDQLAFATSEGRVLFTFDVDFIALHGTGVPHAGLVWTPFSKYTIGALVQNLVIVHAVLDSESMRNHLEYL